jgi:PAS domain S-box-containing protein
MREGRAEAVTRLGMTALDRIDAGDSQVLLMSLAPASHEAAAREAASASLPIQTTSPPPASTNEPARLRFVWQMDAAKVFTIASGDFVSLIGPQSAALLGRPWADIAGEIDPDDRVAAAVGSGTTFDSIPIGWPVGGERAAVELSGTPAFDADRTVQGYRGFGICRDAARLRELAARRAITPPAADPVVAAEPPDLPAETAGSAEPQVKDENSDATIVPFPAPERPALNEKEAIAFDELARTLSDRLKDATPVADDDFGDDHGQADHAVSELPAPAAASTPVPPPRAPVSSESELPIVDRLPLGILIYRLNDLIYANRAFLDWTGYASLQALRDAGGLDSLFIESAPDTNGHGKALLITTPAGKQMPVQGRLFSTQWEGESALVLMLNTQPAPPASRDLELSARRAEVENRELKAVLDTATDGIVLLDRDRRIRSANSSAQALFGFEPGEFAAMALDELFPPESKRAVLDYFDGIARGGSAALLNPGLEVTGRVRGGGMVPLHLSVGPIEGGAKFCAVFRDITAWKRTEEDLVNARRQAESASAAKSDFLAKISHEIRTPLNAIIGFSEVMIEERFGPVANDRYRQYLRDIHTSGQHLISLLNELLDLSKIEAGKLDLTFGGVNLNDLTQQCVAIMQQQANRERVIIRSSLAVNLPQIVADARSIRQIVLNLLSNSIKFTGAGGQVIVSTAVTDGRGVALRVRDTGEGMSDQELKAALEPFRQLATASRWGSSGTGLGLPITKALAEANHAVFNISSTVHDGTLVEVSFPASRVLA